MSGINIGAINFDIISYIADILGILSFLGTAVLWVKSNTILKQIEREKSYYIDEQKAICRKLKTLRESIWKDDQRAYNINSRIRTELYTYKQNYSKLLSLRDRWLLFLFLRKLDLQITDKEVNKIVKHLDYFIARFSKREELPNNGATKTN